MVKASKGGSGLLSMKDTLTFSALLTQETLSSDGSGERPVQAVQNICVDSWILQR